MLQKNAITEVPPNSPGFYSNVFLVRKASGGWRPVIDLKNLNAHIHAPHFRMCMTNSVQSSVQKGDYAFKIDLQDAYFHVPIHPSSRKYLRFAFEKQGVPVSSATIRPEYGPSGFYSIGAQGNRLPAPSGDLCDSISRRLVNSPSRPQSFTPTSSSANEYARPCRLCIKQKEIRAGPDSGYPVSRNPLTSGLRGSFPSRVQSLGDSCSRAPSILPPCSILHSSVPANRVTQLGLRSYPPGSFVPETPSTSFSFVRSDKPVYATSSIRPSGPCQPSTCAGRTHVFLPQESLSACFRRSSRFLLTPPRRGGALTWGIPRFRVPGPIQTASSTSIVWNSSAGVERGGRRRGTRSRAPRPTRGKEPAWSGGAPEGDRVLKRYFMPYSTGLKCSRATRL